MHDQFEPPYWNEAHHCPASSTALVPWGANCRCEIVVASPFLSIFHSFATFLLDSAALTPAASTAQAALRTDRLGIPSRLAI